MNKSIDLNETRLLERDKTAVITFCEAIRTVPDLGVKSITLYGSAARNDYRSGKSDINLLVVLDHITVPVLKRVLGPVARGRRRSIAPFFITEGDLRSSADVFPVKFLAMRESYRVLFGLDVLAELKIAREHVRLRCEQEIKNVLLRMRRHYVMASGRRLPQMMTRMAGGLLDTLRVAVSLTQDSLPSREEVVDIGADRFGFEPGILKRVIDLRHRATSLPSGDVEKLYDEFMAVVDIIAQKVDEMDTN